MRDCGACSRRRLQNGDEVRRDGVAAIVQCAMSVAPSSSSGASSGTAVAAVVISCHSIGSGLRVIARASTSSMRETATISRPFLMLSLISTRSLAFSSGMIIDFFKSPRRLEVENLFLRHQLSIALRRAPPRLRIRGSDRALLVWMIRLWPSLLTATRVVQPETILRWHRAGFTAFWRWKSRKRAGRPKIDRGLRDLIQRMSSENPKSRIHGELLMLGFEVAQSTVSKYMVRGRSPSQSWKTFFRNHAQAIAAIDLFVVPTLTFERLFAFLVLSHGRRQLLWFEVTRHPTAEWLARQITEAFPWASAPTYLVRDNDRAY